VTRNPFPPRITRRTTLGGLAAGTAALSWPGIARAAPDGPFRHGVASGDPDALGAPVAGAELENAKVLAAKGRAGLPLYTDMWDGYPWTREALCDLSCRGGWEDLILLTEYSHSFRAYSLKAAAERPAGIELGAAGITSPGNFVESGFTDALLQALDNTFADRAPEVVWADNMHRDYVRLDLKRTVAKGCFVAVDMVRSRAFGTFIVNRVSYAHPFSVEQVNQRTPLWPRSVRIGIDAMF
jgi:phosphodiesterase/alkaline phosphatase D-like protein